MFDIMSDFPSRKDNSIAKEMQNCTIKIRRIIKYYQAII